MSQSHAAAGPLGTVMVMRRLRGAPGRVRLTVAVCLLLICGSFASAALIEMRLDRARALAQAGEFGAGRAREMATDLSASLDRYAATGAAFASAAQNPETAAALSEAGGPPLRNIAVLDGSGHLEVEMMEPPKDLLPLASGTLMEARRGRTIVAARDGRSIALLFPLRGDIVAVDVDPVFLLSPAGMQDGLLATPAGLLIALGARWNSAPGMRAIALGRASSASRIVHLSEGARLVSLARVVGWPLVVGASLPVHEALGAWYGALPLYFFLILGPAFAGAALAVLFVRVFERHARAAAAIKSLRATRPDEARLLVRLADAERRATDAERAKSRFVSQVSHELRTPLNAIIGFAEVIEGGVFGEPGHRKYAEYARDIGEAGRELHAKIGSVLEFAALDAPRDVSSRDCLRSAIDVAQIAREQIEEMAQSAHARGLKLVVSAPETATARAEAGMIRRILKHLFDNAIAYTPKGGVVRLEIRADAREVFVGVRDTGAGFSAAERPLLGQPFQRFPRAGAPGGMGMGLAIAMGLTRRMGATLSVSSLPAGGTLAELRLAAAASISQL